MYSTSKVNFRTSTPTGKIWYTYMYVVAGNPACLVVELLLNLTLYFISGEYVAQFKFTLLLMPNGTSRYQLHSYNKSHICMFEQCIEVLH